MNKAIVALVVAGTLVGGSTASFAATKAPATKTAPKATKAPASKAPATKTTPKAK